MTDCFTYDDESEWEVVSDEPPFEARSLLRSDDLTLPRCVSPLFESMELQREGGVDELTDNSFSVNPAAVSAFQSDDMTFLLPEGLKLRPLFAPPIEEHLQEGCYVWIPKNIASVDTVSSKECAESDSEIKKLMSSNLELPKSELAASESDAVELQQSFIDEKLEEAKDPGCVRNDTDRLAEEDFERENVKEIEDSRVIVSEDSPKNKKKEVAVHFHAVSALSSFGIAVALMGLVTVVKVFCRDGGGNNKRDVHPHILRFDVCSQHQRISELMLHSSRFNKSFTSTSWSRTVPVSFHISL